MIEFLRGKKAYIGFIAYGILHALYTAEQVSDEVYGHLLALIVAWTGVAVRLAIAKASKP